MPKYIIRFSMVIIAFASLILSGCASSTNSNNSTNNENNNTTNNSTNNSSNNQTGNCSSYCPASKVCVGSSDEHATCADPCDGISCPAGKTCCNGGCVDLFNDANNCGTCLNFCDGTCSNGNCIDACGGVCQQGQKCCDGSCKDVKSDLNNCGECGYSCDPDKANACVNGACMCGTKAACSGSKSCCGNDCKDLMSDVFNCGSCGNQCSQGETCINGECKCGSENCASNQICCGNYCADLNNDPHNCGECGHDCSAEGGPNSQCMGGECTCGSTSQVCKGEINSSQDAQCANYTNDVFGQGLGTCLEECCLGNNEGCAITKVKPMLLMPGGADPNNCGACGNKCDSGVCCCVDLSFGQGGDWNSISCECCGPNQECGIGGCQDATSN